MFNLAWGWTWGWAWGWAWGYLLSSKLHQSEIPMIYILLGQYYSP